MSIPSELPQASFTEILPIQTTHKAVQPFQYPVTEQITVKDDVHGVIIQDNFRWLEEKSEQVNEWVTTQHEFTLSQMHNSPSRM